MFPFVAAAQTSLPSGLNDTANTSHPCSMVSIQLFWYTSHSFKVPSQDPKGDGIRQQDRKLAHATKANDEVYFADDF